MSAISPLRAYYDALHELREYEQTVLAEAHANDPALLLRRFLQSLDEFDGPITQPFYNSARANPADQLGAVNDINSTIKFAAQICDGAPRPVEPDGALAFRYVDRELSPLRTTDQARAPRRSLDLLLANALDGLPIYAELKIGADRPAYFALVQLLALAADLLPESQRERLSGQYGESHELTWPEAGSFADLYIIALNPPQTGQYRARSLAATEQISKALIADERFSTFIRRIAYLEALPEGNRLVFRTCFAYGDGL